MSQIYLDVQTFLDTGGPVLLAIGAVLVMMWTLMLERFYYFYFVFPAIADKTQREWSARAITRPGRPTRSGASRSRSSAWSSRAGSPYIKVFVALCPLFGLLGTVTGMIEVFDVLSIAGSGNARAMAGGVSKATIPTMAGMVAALSGLLLSVRLEQHAADEGERLADRLEIEHGVG